METKSFREHLESILGARASSARPASRLVDNMVQHLIETGRTPNPLIEGITRAQALSADTKEMMGLMSELNEDFILGPLPNNMTLYTPRDLIQVAKDFYANLGFSPTGHTVSAPKYEEIVSFGDYNKGGFVQFDLGRGFRRDNQYELWVTTNFLDLVEK